MSEYYGKFKVGGALLPNHPAYIERHADEDVMELLHQMQYIQIIEPRQQGKTSLINRLIGKIEDYIFCYVDMSTLNDSSKSNEEEWYKMLCSPILKKMNFITEKELSDIPISGNRWRDFLLKIGKLAQKNGKKIVIVLDEIGKANFPWCDFFFSNIRAIYNERAIEPSFQDITFIFAGAFNIRGLISDPNISPFNVAEDLSIPDFNLSQTTLLVKHLGTSEDLTNELSNRIQYYADGQPYITQYLCKHLYKLNKSMSISQKEIDDGVEYFIRKDKNHLPKILELISQDDKLKEYVIKILTKKTLTYMTAANPRLSELEIIGVVKADEKGICKIRNRIYEKVFRRIFLYSNSEKEVILSSRFKHGHALVIGVSDYQKVRKLPKTVIKDAKDIYDVLISDKHCGYMPENTLKLLDDIATGENIREGLKWLAQSSPSESTVLIFFSGHGGRVDTGNEAGTYLLPYNCNAEALKDTSISGEELTLLLRKIKAERLIVFFDCCHSGGIGEPKDLGSKQISFKSGLTDKYYEQLSQGKGRVIIASSRSDEVSLVMNDMDNSLFTFYLLNAVKGEGFKSDDGLIKIFDVFDYISNEVPQRASQHPIFKASDMENNFPIALSSGGKNLGKNTSKIPQASEHINKKILRAKIVEAFSTEELEILCADIEQDILNAGIELELKWDEIGGKSKENKTLKLIEYLDRRGYLSYLVAAIRRERNNLI